MRKDGVVLGSIEGIGADFPEKFTKLLTDLATKEETERLRTYTQLQQRANVDPALCQKLTTSNAELTVLATQPLSMLSQFLKQSQREGEGHSEQLAYDISGHDATRSAVAQSMLIRMEEDVKNYAHAINTSLYVTMNHLSSATLRSYFAGDLSTEKTLTDAQDSIAALVRGLGDVRAADQKIVTELIPLLESAANFIDLQAVLVADRAERIKFMLQREAGSRPTCWLELLFSALLSTKGTEDLIRVNPYLPKDRCDVLLQLVAVVMLRTSAARSVRRALTRSLRDACCCFLQARTASDTRTARWARPCTSPSC
jgi:hypothetical protein